VKGIELMDEVDVKLHLTQFFNQQMVLQASSSYPHLVQQFCCECYERAFDKSMINPFQDHLVAFKAHQMKVGVYNPTPTNNDMVLATHIYVDWLVV
jgi:hypothetical protein